MQQINIVKFISLKRTRIAEVIFQQINSHTDNARRESIRLANVRPECIICWKSRWDLVTLDEIIPFAYNITIILKNKPDNLPSKCGLVATFSPGCGMRKQPILWKHEWMCFLNCCNSTCWLSMIYQEKCNIENLGCYNTGEKILHTDRQ